MKRPDRILPCYAWDSTQMTESMNIILNELSNPPFYSKRARRKEKWKNKFTDGEVYSLIKHDDDNAISEQIVKFNLDGTRENMLNVILGCWITRGYAIAFNKLRSGTGKPKTQTEELWGDYPEEAKLFFQVPLVNGKRLQCCLDTVLKDIAKKAQKRINLCEEYYEAHMNEILQKEPRWDEFSTVYQVYVIEKELAQRNFSK